MKMDFAAIWNEARAAGIAAGREFGKETLPCGFAYICFPGNTAWARWAKKAGIASKEYGGGLSVVSYAVDRTISQSLDKKRAAIGAAVGVLRKHGIEVTVRSWED